MKRSHDDRLDFPPIEYLIPRCGTVHRVRVCDRDELRVFRTELELLRRIAGAVRTQAPALSMEHPRTLAPEAYLELDWILHDASHPLVEAMIARVDREFADLRKDIVMSVVDEEAKKIAAEATEAGINTSTVPDEGGPADLMDEMSVDEALDVAQAGLVAAVTGDSSPSGKAATPSSPASSAPPDPVEEALAPNEPEPIAATVNEPTQAQEKPADVPSELVEVPSVSGSDDSSAPASSVAEGSGIGAEHVENAVAVIEQGIRKLATLLRGEIQEQWTRAHKTLEEVDSSRTKMDEERRSTQEMLEEIARLRDEARVARDETDLARQEAKREREAARVAKERAETSAAVAELAADQARRESALSRESGSPDGTT